MATDAGAGERAALDAASVAQGGNDDERRIRAADAADAAASLRGDADLAGGSGGWVAGAIGGNDVATLEAIIFAAGAGVEALEAEVVRSTAMIVRANDAIGDPGWVNDLCECSACQKVKATHGAYSCERCGYQGPIGTIACQRYDYSCRGAGENSRGTGCPHGFGTCPVCGDGEADVRSIIREVRAALAPQAGAGDEAR